MASFRIERPDLFPNGTVVKAFLLNSFHGWQPGSPVGTVVAEAIASSSAVELSGLAEGTTYMAYALVGGADRYLAFGKLPAAPTTAPTTALLPSGGDDSGALQALVTTNCDILLGPGTFLWNTAPVKLPRNATGIRIRGSGEGVTVIKLSTSAPRFLDFDRTADYQTFQNIAVTDLTVDVNNVGGQGHCVLGTYTPTYPTPAQRINLQGIRVRRVTVVNAPSDANIGTNHRLGVYLVSYHPEVNEATQTQVTDVVVEDFTMRCGNGGVFVAAGGPAGGANVLVDNIRGQRWEQTVPLPKTTEAVALSGTFEIPVTSTAGWAPAGRLRAKNTERATVEIAYTSLDATHFKGCTMVAGTGTLMSGAGVGYPVTSNFQVGSRAIGGQCVLRDIKAGGSGDNALELNAMTNALVENMEVTDDLNAAYVQINYQNPQYPLAQRIVYRNCSFRRTDPSSEGVAFSPGSATSIANLNQVVFERCKLYVDTDGVFNGSGQAIAMGPGAGSKVQKLVVKGFEVYHRNINVALTASSSTSWFLFRSTLSGCEITLEGIDAVISGAVTGGMSTISRLISLAGTDTVYSIRDVRWDFNVSGTSGGGVEGITIGAAASSVLRGDVTRFIVKQLVASAPRAVRIAAGNLTVDSAHPFTFHECDFSKMVSGTEVSHETLSVTGPVTFLRATGFATRPAPTALTGLTTAVGKALATMWPVHVVFKQGTGEEVTAIDYSTNGGTTYTNFLTQAAGALPAGFDQTLGPLTTDALIKVTFAKAQPTITLVPVDA